MSPQIQPAVPEYVPCLAITVLGSNASHCAALPPYSRSIVCALSPELGPRSPAMSSKVLNRSGCTPARPPAHAPPSDIPHPPTNPPPPIAREPTTRRIAISHTDVLLW